MAQIESKLPIATTENEKISTIMLYCPTLLVRGEVVTTQAMRVSTWLRTQAAPDYMHIHNAQVLLLGSTGPAQSIFFQEYFIPTTQISAYHLAPPTADPVDYDPSEPNRKIEPVTVLAGAFRFNGVLRMASQTDLSKYLDLTRENFTSLYDVDVTNPSIAGIGTIHVKMALVRSRAVTFAARPGTTP